MVMLAREISAYIMCDIDFTNCQLNQIWMCQQGDVYKFIGICVDDLAIATKYPSIIIKQLEQHYTSGFKGVGP
jgi:hypothetical protein